MAEIKMVSAGNTLFAVEIQYTENGKTMRQLLKEAAKGLLTETVSFPYRPQTDRDPGEWDQQKAFGYFAQEGNQ